MALYRRNVSSISKTGSTALTGDVTLSEGSNISLTQSSQDISIGATGLALSSLAYVTIGNTASLSAERALTGTSNQVIITDNGANSTVVLSTPQDIATSSSPTFADLTLTGGDLIASTATTFNVFNTVATTVNAFGAATTLELGAATGTTSVNNSLTIDGDTTIGNASGDAVTVNSATWTFANDTNFALSGGVNGLSFDTSTLSIDATNDRVGIGNTAPVSHLDISSTSTANPRGIVAAQFNNGTNSSLITFRKSRGTTVGTNTILSSGDSIGTLIAAGADGTNYVQSAYIQFQVDGTPGTNDMPGRIIFATTADGGSASTERMRITQEGYVGIGGTPSNLFLVNGTVVDSSNATLVQVTAATNSSTNNQIGANFTVNAGPTSASSQIYFGMNFAAQSVTNNVNGELQAFRGGSLHAGTNTLTTASGGVFVNTNYTTGTITDSIALRTDSAVKTAGTITNNIGVYVSAMTTGTNNAGQMIGEATGSNSSNLIIGQLSIPTGQFSIYNSSSDNNYINGNTGFGTTTPTSFKVEVAGNVGPDGNKTRDLGSTSKRWNNIYYVTATTGTSRLVTTSVICSECNQPMQRGTGVDITLGETFDFTEVYCFDCGKVGIEKFHHLPSSELANRRPCPVMYLTDFKVQNLSGNTRTIRIGFRYGDDVYQTVTRNVKNYVTDTIEQVTEEVLVEPAITNSTVLGENELVEFMAMTDNERKNFLRDLGQREWDALEEARLLHESIEEEQAIYNNILDGLMNVNLLA